MPRCLAVYAARPLLQHRPRRSMTQSQPPKRVCGSRLALSLHLSYIAHLAVHFSRPDRTFCARAVQRRLPFFCTDSSTFAPALGTLGSGPTAPRTRCANQVHTWTSRKLTRMVGATCLRRAVCAHLPAFCGGKHLFLSYCGPPVVKRRRLMGWHCDADDGKF